MTVDFVLSELDLNYSWYFVYDFFLFQKIKCKSNEEFIKTRFLRNNKWKNCLLQSTLSRDIWHKHHLGHTEDRLRNMVATIWWDIGNNPWMSCHVNIMLPIHVIHHTYPEVPNSFLFWWKEKEFMYNVSICLKMSQSLSITSRMAQFSGNCLTVSKGVPLEIEVKTAIVGNRRV